MNARKIRRLAYGGLLTAIIAAITAFVRINIPGGYIHPGDSAIALSAILLGPYAAIPAGLGSFMADMLGYPAYAPYTLVIKALMGLIAGYGCLGGRLTAKSIASLVLGALVLVAGYFVTDTVMGGVGLAFADLFWNALQALIFVVSGVALLAIKISRLANKL